MRQFEDEVVIFLKPILLEDATIRLTEQQQKSLAGWLALIATLAEYANNHHPTIKRAALLHLKKRRLPPEDFHIYVARSAGPKWRKHYSYHNFLMYEGISSIDAVPHTADGRPRYNTQVSTMGIGSLLAHIFSGPASTPIQSYSIALEGSQLERIWPPKRSFWMRQDRLLEFPLKTELQDYETEILAEDLRFRINTFG
ncbi:hypothetical protein [Bradyrhizobium sp. Arg816]|uniref:hypothetical protein n=1 Tax=Bradyrhizobium sp. Arg816 TaxID=2998491 RepID=UPI00249E0AEC|nr:hypothetical protein [Bradyrhizobium sp. Arg816]MDI3566571.1 hypothetical protein [Bradyrhizobium sp. Arg816]